MSLTDALLQFGITHGPSAHHGRQQLMLRDATRLGPRERVKMTHKTLLEDMGDGCECPAAHECGEKMYQNISKLDALTRAHLTAWLDHAVGDNYCDRDDAVAAISQALADDDTLIDRGYTWAEIRSRGQ